MQASGLAVMKYPPLKCDTHAGCCVNAGMDISDNCLFVLAGCTGVVPDGAAGQAMVPECGTCRVR